MKYIKFTGKCDSTDGTILNIAKIVPMIEVTLSIEDGGCFVKHHYGKSYGKSDYKFYSITQEECDRISAILLNEDTKEEEIVKRFIKNSIQELEVEKAETP